MYKSSIDIINEFGYENTIINIKNSKNKDHNLIKLVILKLFYRKFFRKLIFDLIYKDDEKGKEIEIILSRLKLIDYTNIENVLNKDEIKDMLAKQILEFNQSYESKVKNKLNMFEKINYLFDSRLLIPVTDDFLRFHKQTEKYEKTSKNLDDSDNKKDQTKLRYIINKMDKIKDSIEWSRIKS